MLDRRQLILIAASAAATGAPVLGLAQASITLDQFMDLSRRLVSAPDLDRGVGQKLLDGLIATGRGDALGKLVADINSVKNLADEIVAQWYSGMYDSGKGPAVAAYDQALQWRALSFTKPPGFCGGETGYWRD